MHRRTYLALGGAALAGCSDAIPGTGGEEYDHDDEPSLLFDGPQDEWPDDLERDDSLNEDFDQGYISQDETVGLLVNVEIEVDTETAENEMQMARVKAGNHDNYPLADEAFIADDNLAAWVIFRHRNAHGQTLVLRRSGGESAPDRDRASEYAESLFDHWRE